MVILEADLFQESLLLFFFQVDIAGIKTQEGIPFLRISRHGQARTDCNDPKQYGAPSGVELSDGVEHLMLLLQLLPLLV